MNNSINSFRGSQRRSGTFLLPMLAGLLSPVAWAADTFYESDGLVVVEIESSPAGGALKEITNASQSNLVVDGFRGKAYLATR